MSMISLAAARRRVLAGCVPLHPRAVPFDQALGCVTSVALSADAAVPPFANTAVDGFAVQAADTDSARPDAPVVLEVVGTLAAGAPPDVAVTAGRAVRIMTGAPIPDGADAIVMVEDTEPVDGGSSVRISQAATAGAHIRPAGEDVRPGQEVFPALSLITPGHLGVLASLGVRRVPVFPRARVGVLSTGDELVEGPGPLAPGQIRDTNRATLLALAAASGFTPIDLGLARDTEADVRAALEGALGRCDAVLTTGGVSMGEFDYVKVVLDHVADGGFSWMQVAIKPAKPLAFGVVGDVPVFGLPGNPVSCMVSFECFARPGIRARMGFPVDALGRPRVRAVADDGLPRRPDGKLHLMRVACAYGEDGHYHVRTSGGQASNLLRSMALANALALVADGTGVEPGAEVDTWLLS